MRGSLKAGISGLSFLFFFVGNIPVAPASTLLFELTNPNPNNIGFTNDSDGHGNGQGVSVSQDITLTNMAMYFYLPQGGEAKFTIWNGDNSAVLFSTTELVSASATGSWVLSPDFSFVLSSGKTYWFGVAPKDNNLLLGAIGNLVYQSNGLMALTTGNSAFDGYDDPSLSFYGGSDIALRLYGEVGSAAVPLPATLPLFASGLAGLGWLGRRRRKQAAAASLD